MIAIEVVVIGIIAGIILFAMINGTLWWWVSRE